MDLRTLHQHMRTMGFRTGWTLDGALNLLDTNPDSVALMTIREADRGFHVSTLYMQEHVEAEDMIPYLRGFVSGYRSERRAYH